MDRVRLGLGLGLGLGFAVILRVLLEAAVQL